MHHDQTVLADADAVAARGRFHVAVSGGRTPWAMFQRLAMADVPWASSTAYRVEDGHTASRVSAHVDAWPSAVDAS